MLVNHLEVKGVCPLGLVLPLISFMTFNKTAGSSTTNLGGLSELNGKNISHSGDQLLLLVQCSWYMVEIQCIRAGHLIWCPTP